MLADALPDDFGNALIDAWMAREGVGTSQITSLDRLAYMGKRGHGRAGVQARARPEAVRADTAIEMAELVESARRAVQGEIDTDAHAEAALAQIIQVGTSAGGARAKAVVAWNPSTARDPRGAVRRAGRVRTLADQVRRRRAPTNGLASARTTDASSMPIT